MNKSVEEMRGVKAEITLIKERVNKILYMLDNNEREMKE